MPLTRNFKENFQKTPEKFENMLSFIDSSIGEEINRNLLSLGDNEFIEVEKILGKNKKY